MSVFFIRSLDLSDNKWYFVQKHFLAICTSSQDGMVEARSVNVKKTTTTRTAVANPARGLLTREKKTKEKLWRVVSQFNLFHQNTTTN